MPNNRIQSLTVDGATYDIVDNTSGYATLASPNFTGTPTAPTPTAGDDSTKIATTAYVQEAMSDVGAGTVTSVGLQNATNGGLSISGSPITSSGIITIGLDTAYGDTKNPYGSKNINTVLAGPSSGSAAAPSFRTLVASDIPDLSGTYLTSFTETDPVYSASAAAGITSTDIVNWNGKTSNVGTVTSVGLTNATNGGLSISGSPITSSGSITIGHSNILTSAQTTQAVYPIKIDKNGHISDYGSAVTISDTKVTQSAAITTAGQYPVILGYNTGTAAVTNTVNKSANLTYNPSTKKLTNAGAIQCGTIDNGYGLNDQALLKAATITKWTAILG